MIINRGPRKLCDIIEKCEWCLPERAFAVSRYLALVCKHHANHTVETIRDFSGVASILSRLG